MVNIHVRYIPRADWRTDVWLERGTAGDDWCLDLGPLGVVVSIPYK